MDKNGTLNFEEFRQLYLHRLLPMIEEYLRQQRENEEANIDMGDSTEMEWQCDVCESTWGTLEEASACEDRCNGQRTSSKAHTRE